MTQQLESIIIVESLWVVFLASGGCVLARSDGYFMAFESTLFPQASCVRHVTDAGRNVKAPPAREASEL